MLGSVLSSRYRLDGELGRGGMGVVYRAYDLTMRRAVAIKVLPERYGDDAEAQRRFLNEVRHIAQLSHPHIVPVFDQGQHEATIYYVMELIVGTDLRAEMQARGRFPLDETLALARQIAAALDYAHEKGLVHRDIKPGNILLDTMGRARIVDFGIAKSIDATSMTSATAGTPKYMSPEQAKGKKVDGQADQYAFAIMVYEMLTGTVPFTSEDSNSFTIMMKHISDPPPDPRKLRPELPAHVTTCLRTALAKQPTGRFASCTAFVEALADPTKLQVPAAPKPIAKPVVTAPPTTPQPPGVTSSPSHIKPPTQRSAAPSAGIAVRLRAALTPLPARVTLWTLLVLTIGGGLGVTAWRTGFLAKLADAPGIHAIIPPALIPYTAPTGRIMVWDWSESLTPVGNKYATYSFATRQMTPISTIRKDWSDGRWSPDGTLFTYQLIAETQWQIFLADGTGNGSKQLTHEKIPCRAPAISFDNTTIAFYAGAYMAGSMIQAMNIDGGNPRTIFTAKEGEVVYAPNFTADHRVLFTREWKDHADVYAINLDGTGLTRITPGDGMFNILAQCDRNGRVVYIVYGKDVPRSRIYLTDLSGATPRLLVDPPEQQYSSGPIFSPDGKHVAFVLLDIENKIDHDNNPATPEKEDWSNLSDLYIIGVDGKHLTKISDTRQARWMRDWVP